MSTQKHAAIPDQTLAAGRCGCINHTLAIATCSHRGVDDACSSATTLNGGRWIKHWVTLWCMQIEAPPTWGSTQSMHQHSTCLYATAPLYNAAPAAQRCFHNKHCLYPVQVTDSVGFCTAPPMPQNPDSDNLDHMSWHLLNTRSCCTLTSVEVTHVLGTTTPYR